MPEELQVNFCEDREPALLVLAVHVDRNEAPGCLINLGKDPLYTSRLPGPRQSPQYGVQRPRSLQTWT